MRRMPVGREPGQTHIVIVQAHSLPDKDIPILAAAISQRVDLLVTGDRRDSGHLYGSSPGGVEIIGLPVAIKRLLDELE